MTILISTLYFIAVIPSIVFCADSSSTAAPIVQNSPGGGNTAGTPGGGNTAGTPGGGNTAGTPGGGNTAGTPGGGNTAGTPGGGNTAGAPGGGNTAGAGSSSGPAGGIAYLPGEDEDEFINSKIEIGNELMRTQMARYIQSVVANLVGLSSENTNTEKIQKRYPVIRLLELSKIVMQKTCLPVTTDYFNLASSSFINLQLENFHLKEPYISYSAFLRIENALKRCITDAKPHTFYTGPALYINKTKEYCDNSLSTKTSNQTIRSGSEVINTTVPEYATGLLNDTHISEPLIETVWKIVVNAHSYCYTKFSDYYNDHHTFTVALLPLFTNGIQDIWLSGYNLNDKNILYGGLLGDPRKLINDVNNCVAASRQDGMAYPWFMNRPPKDKTNMWYRRKRHASIINKQQSLNK